MLPLIRCLAVDDEAYALTLLADYIQQVPFLTLVKTTTSPLDALNCVQQGQVDLVFLDIQMPELTGLQFLHLCGTRCKVIMTTAYPEYALDGYDHDVVDYLLKPIAFDRFLKGVQKALPLFMPSTLPQNTPLPLATMDTPTSGYLFLKGDVKNQFLRVDHADIRFIEGLKNYVSIQLTTKRLISYTTLKELSHQLPTPPFVRIHRSYIVALDKVRLVEGNTVYVGEKRLPIGETYRDNFYRFISERH